MLSGWDVGIGGRGFRVCLKVRGSNHAALILVIRVGIGVVHRGLEGHGVDDFQTSKCIEGRAGRMCTSTAAKRVERRDGESHGREV